MQLKTWDLKNYLGFKIIQIFRAFNKHFKKEHDNKCVSFLMPGKRYFSKYELLHGAVGSMDQTY